MSNRQGGEGCFLLDDQCTKTGRPVAEARAIVARIVNFPQGGRPTKRPSPRNITTTGPKHPRGQGTGKQKDERQGERGKREDGNRGKNPKTPPRRKVEQTEERHMTRERRVEMESEEEEDRMRRKGSGQREPQGGKGRGHPRGGGTCPPWRKKRTSRDSPLNVRTCCCRESMETS